MARTRALRTVASALFGLTLVFWVLGCSSRGNGPAERVVRSEGQALVGPFTVTLAVPNPLSPLAPVLTGVNSVMLGSNSTVVSGTVVSMGSGGSDAEPGALIKNDLWSRGTAALKDRVAVNGTVHASSVTLGNQTSIAHTDATPLFDPPTTLTWTVTYPNGSGSDVTINAGQSRTLAPGLYGSLQLNSQSTLNLRTGTYFLTNLDVESQATVNLNQTLGPIIIYVANNVIHLRGAFVPVGGSDAGIVHPDLLIGYLGTSALFVESLFDGAIVAPFAPLTLRQVTGVHTGYFYAQPIALDSSAQVQYRFPRALVRASNPNGDICSQLLDAGLPPQSVPFYCLCSSPDDTDNDGVPDCIDGCPYDHHKKRPGISGCNVSDTDSDGDGVPDSIDRCPSDPNNAEPGQCGCIGLPGLKLAGTPCTDTACPQAGATCNGAGVCGNRAACNPCPPNGRLIVKNRVATWFCGVNFPQESVPDGGSENLTTGGTASQAVAQAACSSTGLTLLRIDTPDLNQQLAQFMTAPVWLGANDLQTSGQWLWSQPNNNNGDLFWSGGPTGSPQNNLYSNWGVGAPGSARCASILPVDGHWFDTNCNESLGYICDFHPPPPGLATDAGDGVPGSPIPGGPKFPIHFPPGPCVNEFDLDAGGLPDSLAELIHEVDAARHGTFVGAAKNPPPDGSTTCPADEDPNAGLTEAIGLDPDASAGCTFTNAQQVNFPTGGDPDGGPYTGDCLSDDDCAKFVGPGFVCRQLKDQPNCHPPDASDAAMSLDPATACLGGALCVKLHCPQVTDTCREVRICRVNTDFDASPDPTLNLDAGVFDPAAMFGGTLPDSAPSAEYFDPPHGDGGDHTWCHMVPQHPVAAANQPAQNTNGSSGQGSPISFSFDPNLVFNVNPNPLALGENAMDIHAAATLTAAVQLHNFLGQDYRANIVDIGAGVQAHRCSVHNDETKFMLLGVDVLSSLGLGIPQFDSTKLFPPQTKACNDAIGEFTLWSNRAKKAFRDAQQLLNAYNDAKQHGNRIASTLCQDILSAVSANDVAFFPGGLTCPAGEPVEVTINRFVDYLQAPGVGQISQLRHAASNLVNRSTDLLNNSIPKMKVDFLDLERDESQTILNVPFAIGPVPMVLQIDVFANYGIAGNFNVILQAPLAKMAGLDDSNTKAPGQATPLRIAQIEVDVAPWAAAGLSAFVGAGVDLGAFSATLGIEGQVTLGKVSAPVYAGAGLDLLEEFDPRPIPGDIGPVSLSSAANPLGTMFQFNVPKSFNLMVWFKYGAGIQLSDILSGAINAKLHVSFFFFSSTWRVQIVHFNGWSKFYNLVNGSVSAGTSHTTDQSLNSSHAPAPTGATTIVSTAKTGGPSMGLDESQLPLTVLQALPVPIADAGAGGDAGAADAQIVNFDAAGVVTVFYDNQCCAHNHEQCDPAGTPHCCPDFDCILQIPDASDSGSCRPRCVTDGGTCKPDAEVSCCGSLVCGSERTCQPPCVPNGGTCFSNPECCSFATGGECVQQGNNPGTCQ
jgi:hypothetical protein